jgi:hypothetical protein
MTNFIGHFNKIWLWEVGDNMSNHTSTLITNKREQLKTQMDDFATFQWRGQDM